jgi:hypothetical protein
VILEVEHEPAKYQPAAWRPVLADPELEDWKGVPARLDGRLLTIKGAEHRYDGLYLWCVADDERGSFTAWLLADRLGPA